VRIVHSANRTDSGADHPDQLCTFRADGSLTTRATTLARTIAEPMAQPEITTPQATTASR
jgi:hypothetical protein